MKTIRNILLVEDNKHDQFFFTNALREIPNAKLYYVANNGQEAMKRLELSTYVPDIIFTDIYMPVMDGLEFVKQLSAVPNAKDVPVVMITTEGSEAHVVQALSSGARGYIRKPFTPEQVKEQVIPVLAGKS